MSEVTQQDVIDLYKDSSVEKRTVLATKLGADMMAGDLSDTEVLLAQELCQKLSEDVDISVRKALSEALKKCDAISRELAENIASDVLEVSLPMLEFSSLLDDPCLVNLIKTGDADRQMAISKRASINPGVSHALCEEGTEPVVNSVLGNSGAAFFDKTFELVLDKYDGNASIQETMVHRTELPESIVIKLVDLVGDHLKSYLLMHHEFSPVMSEKLVLESKADARKRLLDTSEFAQRNVAEMIETLSRKGKLTDQIILRALEIGDRAFFEMGMAKRAGISADAAQQLIRDPGEKGFSALYVKAGFEKSELGAVRFMLDAEYHNKRHAPITQVRENAKAKSGQDTWLTETEKPAKKKWGLF